MYVHLCSTPHFTLEHLHKSVTHTSTHTPSQYQVPQGRTRASSCEHTVHPHWASMPVNSIHLTPNGYRVVFLLMPDCTRSSLPYSLSGATPCLNYIKRGECIHVALVGSTCANSAHMSHLTERTCFARSRSVKLPSQSNTSTGSFPVSHFHTHGGGRGRCRVAAFARWTAYNTTNRQTDDRAQRPLVRRRTSGRDRQSNKHQRTGSVIVHAMMDKDAHTPSLDKSLDTLPSRYILCDVLSFTTYSIELTAVSFTHWRQLGENDFPRHIKGDRLTSRKPLPLTQYTSF